MNYQITAFRKFPPQMDDPAENSRLELYRIAAQTRNLEIDLFWRRSNYFLVLSTSIAIGFFTKEGTETPYAPLLALFGAVVAVLWFLVNLGSKYWQSRWEHRASVIERAVFPDANLFSAPPDLVRADVEASLRNASHGRLRRCLDHYMLDSKPSVSFIMTLLSGLFFVFWILVLFVSLCRGQPRGVTPTPTCIPAATITAIETQLMTASATTALTPTPTATASPTHA